MTIKSFLLYLFVFNSLLIGTVLLATSPDDNVYMSDPDASDDIQNNSESQQDYNSEDNTNDYPYYPYYPQYYPEYSVPSTPSGPGYSLPNGFNQTLSHNQGFNTGINNSMYSKFPTLQMKGATSSGNQTTFPTLHPK